MKTFDAVIIGAGLAGLQCAKLIGLSGANVLLVDRKADPAKGIHTTGIFVRKTFEDFSFPAGALGRPIRSVTIYSPRMRPIELTSEADEFRIGRMDLLYNAFLNECLNAGVEFMPSTRFFSTRAVNGQSTVALEANGRQIKVGAKVLVGADGANSAVAKALGLDRNREMIVGVEEVYRRTHLHDEARLHCFLDAELAPGYLAWIADDGVEVHIGVGGYPSRFNPRTALERFKAKLSRGVFDSGDIDFRESRGGCIPVGGILRNIANERGLLIGDAAGAVSPLTAGGLDPCLRLSTFAANVIGMRITSGDPFALSAYSGAAFRPRFTSRLWMRRVLASLRRQTLLELGCTILRCDLGRNFAKHVFFGRGSFPDVPLHNSSEIGVLQP